MMPLPEFPAYLRPHADPATDGPGVSATLASFEARLAKAGIAQTGDGHIPPEGVALLLVVSVKTLRNWRSDGKGPPWRKRNRQHIDYPLAGVAAFSDAAAKFISF